MADRKNFESEFKNADGARSGSMARAREWSALTIASTLPPRDTTGESDILRPYQNLGSSGVSNMINKLSLALFPSGFAWWREQPSAKLRALANNDDRSSAEYARLLDLLYEREQTILRQLEQMRLRTCMRTVIEHLIIVGNALPMLTDEYRLRAFRLDQYVQKKASDGEVLWLMTFEKADPLQLSDEHLARAQLKRADLMAKSVTERAVELYTKAQKQRSGAWLIQQEINDKLVNESEEPVSRYFPAGYVELPSEDYSRSFVEERVGASLRSFNGLTRAILEGAVGAAKMLWAADEATGLTPADLAKPNLSVIVARVAEDGRIKGAGVLKADKLADFTVAGRTYDAIRQELSSAMLMESSMQPQKDRVTATQIIRIAQELEGATGGVYSHIAEELQYPLIKRVIWQMTKDKKLAALPPGISENVDIEILTGVEALSRARESEAARGLVQDVGNNPELMRRLRPEWLIKTYVRGYAIDERDAVKPQEEIDAEDAKMAEMQAKMQLAQTAMQTGGKVIENAAKPG